MIGCQSTLAGRCLGLAPVNVWLASLLWAGAALAFDRWRLEVRDG